MSTDSSDTTHLESPHAELERTLIAEFLRSRGYDPLTLADLPAPARAQLLRDASIYASAKLTEVESRARFVHELHDVPRPKSSGE